MVQNKLPQGKSLKDSNGIGENIERLTYHFVDYDWTSEMVLLFFSTTMANGWVLG
jgi:hypothetical protein